MNPEIKVEQEEQDREINRCVDCWIELMALEKQVFKKYGFSSFSDLRRTSDKMALLLAGGTILRGDHEALAEERTSYIHRGKPDKEIKSTVMRIRKVQE